MYNLLGALFSRHEAISAAKKYKAGVVQWQNGSFPSFRCGFDSRRPLQILSMQKDKWLIISILCLIVCFIEGYNLNKTLSRHKAPAGEKPAAVAIASRAQSGHGEKENASQQKTNGKTLKNNGGADSAVNESAKQKKETEVSKDLASLPASQGKEPPSPKRAKAVPVTFTYTDSEAASVTFHGSWSGKAYEMNKKGDTWKIRLSLNPGEYAYHFRVDGVKKTNQGTVNAAGDNIIKVSPAE